MSDNSEVLPKDRSAKPSVARQENILVVAESDRTFESDFNSAKRIGQIVAFVVFGVFGTWALVMPIEGAAHAPGQVTVKSFKKPVQHLEGGIIKQVLVKDGDMVKTGDVLVVLDDTQAKSQLASFTTQRKARLAQAARLIAERDSLAAVSYPPELHTDDAEAMAEINAQNHIFKTRKTNLAGDIAVLQQNIEQLQSRVTGLEAVRQVKTSMAASYQEELKDFQSLLAQGFADKNRLRELERSYQLTSGEAADIATQIATTKIQIGETKLQMSQLQNKGQTEVASMLSESQTVAKDLSDRITALADTVQRAQVRSPDNGSINNLKVHTAGSVIPPGAILAEIVPQNEELVIDAKVSPIDIDLVAIGQEASVQLSAFNSRTLPKMNGKVIGLSSDAIVDSNGASYYLARLELTPEAIKTLSSNHLTLISGMPAEVFINTGPRTFFQYVMKPLSDGLSHTFRED